MCSIARVCHVEKEVRSLTETDEMYVIEKNISKLYTRNL